MNNYNSCLFQSLYRGRWSMTLKTTSNFISIYFSTYLVLIQFLLYSFYLVLSCSKFRISIIDLVWRILSFDLLIHLSSSTSNRFVPPLQSKTVINLDGFRATAVYLFLLNRRGLDV